ncbi:MAG: CotH kinase family protein [Bacteroidaceae bacterium]|nr:CotH kinase family protein [Bacteroidaceae bacterium]
MRKSILLFLLSSLCLLISSAQELLPTLSMPHGIYENPFMLDITCEDSTATIYYTTDGKWPTTENSTIYTTPIPITGTNIIRAIAVDTTGFVGKVSTSTYIFLEDVINQGNNPTGYPSEWGKYATRSGRAVADYEMDPEMTNDEQFRDLLKEGFLSLPIVSIVTDPGHLFNPEEDENTGGIYIYTGAPSGSGQPGRGWERPVSFELFDAEGKHDLQIDCGIKIHGGHSRLPEKSPKHSFRLVFRKEFGEKKLKYPLFGEKEPSKFNAVVLRTAFCNSWHHQENSQREIAVYSRDMWAKQTQKEMGHLTTNGIYAHLFINGLYWGMYNPTERIDDDFCEAHLGDDKEDYNVIKVEEYGTGHVVIADAGDMEQWNELFALADKAEDMDIYYQMQGLDRKGEYVTEYTPLLDVDNFIDYMLINYYGGNTDWDSHNWLAVRNHSKNDKGFYFICWDSEHILKEVDRNVLSKKTSLSPTYLFHKLMKNAAFKRYFMDKVQEHCFDNGILTSQRNADRWLALDAIIDTALYCEQARWGDYRRDVHPYTKKGALYTKEDYYDSQRTFLLDEYFPKRTTAFISQLKEKGWFPDVESPIILYGNEPAIGTDTIDAEEGLTLTGEGKIYYTTDGNDPVSWTDGSTGITNKSAILYEGERITADSSFTLKAIAYQDKQWSAVRKRHFSVHTQESDGIAVANVQLPQLQPYCNKDGTITLKYTTTSKAKVSLTIFNLQGQAMCHPIRDKEYPAGTHQVPIIDERLPFGLYICRLTVGNATVSKKIVIK